jgi:hypothetical protein
MRSKLFMVLLLLAVAVGGTGIVTVKSRGIREAPAGVAALAPQPVAQPVAQQPDPDGVIDGAKNPEKVSDQVAYSLFLRFLSGRKTEEEKNRARAYLKMVFGCHTCRDEAMTAEERQAAQAGIEKLLAAAEEYERRVGPLDEEAKKVKERGGPSLDSSAKVQLKDLKRKKEALVNQLIASLPARLGASGAGRLNRFMRDHFKRRVKINPARDANQAAAGTGDA